MLFLTIPYLEKIHLRPCLDSNKQLFNFDDNNHIVLNEDAS